MSDAESTSGADLALPSISLGQAWGLLLTRLLNDTEREEGQ